MANISEQSGASLEIRTGESASEILRAQPRRLRRGIALESEATYDAPDIALWRLRGFLADLLRPFFERLRRRFPAFPPAFADAFLRRLYPSTWFGGWTLKQEREWAWADTLKLLDQARMAVALVDGRLAGVIGYKLGGRMADGREVFEITKSSTLPRFRKRGINRRLRAAILDLIARRHGLAPVMSLTRNPSVIRRCRTLGWQELSLEEYGELLQRVGRSGPPAEFMAVFKRRWRAFLYDPRAFHAGNG